MSLLGPSSNLRKLFLGARNPPRPPGKYGEPVKRARTSAPARLKVLWPEVYAAKAGVTKVSFWYGAHSFARIHCTPPYCVVGSVGPPGHAKTAISPMKAARAACRWPGALDSGVITSTSPGTSGSPSGLYDG